MNSTKEFYKNNSLKYFNYTFNINNSIRINKISNMIPKNGKILDVGCGSGRDVISLRNMNIKAYGFDDCKELIELAKNKGSKDWFKVESFENFNGNYKYDLIMANASLLHLSKSDLSSTIDKLLTGLKNNGILMFALKEGIGSKYNECGRFFSYYQKDEIFNLMKNKKVVLQEFYKDSDEMNRDNTVWLNFYYKFEKQ
jgi:2-polyprenyl-3-methyl-5-hydroxy-6-metoxy-1,4-benzoquinol methylase